MDENAKRKKRDVSTSPMRGSDSFIPALSKRPGGDALRAAQEDKRLRDTRTKGTNEESESLRGKGEDVCKEGKVSPDGPAAAAAVHAHLSCQSPGHDGSAGAPSPEKP